MPAALRPFVAEHWSEVVEALGLLGGETVLDHRPHAAGQFESRNGVAFARLAAENLRLSLGLLELLDQEVDVGVGVDVEVEQEEVFRPAREEMAVESELARKGIRL